MFICKEVNKKYEPVVEDLFKKVAKTTQVFLERYRDEFDRLVRNEMMMGSLDEIHGLELGGCQLTIGMHSSDKYTKARSFIANKTTGMSMRLLLDSLVEAEENRRELPSHLEGHISEHGARSWHWRCGLSVNDLSSSKEELMVDTTAAIVALSIIAKECNTWLSCNLAFPESNYADVLPVTEQTIADACKFNNHADGYVATAIAYCKRTFKLEDLVNMQLIEFTEEDVALNKAEWAKQNPVEEKEVETV